MIYIHKDINFWKTKVKLPDSYLISTDIDDYEVGAYLPLSEEQEQYHNEHPDATPLECWHMQPAPEPEPTPEELLWRARDAKRQEIYDKDIHHYYIDEILNDYELETLIRVKKDDYQQSIAYIKLISIYSHHASIDELQQQVDSIQMMMET